MLRLFVLLHTTLFQARLLRTHARFRSHPTRDERGSVTTEHVLWAVAVIAIVGIVVAAVKAYVTSQAGNLK
jgi:heme/copper-type cytochrome/quinol oxidase subunit 2